MHTFNKGIVVSKSKLPRALVAKLRRFDLAFKVARHLSSAILGDTLAELRQVQSFIPTGTLKLYKEANVLVKRIQESALGSPGVQAQYCTLSDYTLVQHTSSEKSLGCFIQSLSKPSVILNRISIRTKVTYARNLSQL